MNSLDGKTALVTGGGGFIGGTLVEHLATTDVETIRVLDNDEHGLFRLRHRLDLPADRLQPCLGDLRNADRVETAMDGVDVVFHAGAIKRVECGEANPFQTVRTNVHGTQNAVRAAARHGVESFTAVSTDKASNPISVMGATKLLSERIAVAANAQWPDAGTRFNCVRFGNVLGSTGSVVSVFLDQIASGGPISVTDPEMTRFIMSVDRAVDLLLDAHGRMHRGEVAVLKMPAFRVGDLSEALRSAYAPAHGHDPAEVDIEIDGKRPGERVHEKLVARDELPNTYETEEMFVIRPELNLGGDPSRRPAAPVETPGGDDRPAARDGEARDWKPATLDGEYTSADADLLTREELQAMVAAVVETPAAGQRSAVEVASSKP